MADTDKFVHLHVHSQYSLLESSVRSEDLIAKVSELKMPAVAVTDHGNMFGAVEFYLNAKKGGVKPILGCEVYIAPGGRLQKGGGPANGGRGQNPQSLARLVLLATNIDGYHDLCQLVSRGYTEGFYYKPRVDYEILKTYGKHLIALTSSPQGDVPAAFLNQGADVALKKIRFYKEIFDDRLYLEMQRNGSPAWETLNPFLKEASVITGVPLVATNDVHYLNREEAMAHEILLCTNLQITKAIPFIICLLSQRQKA
jgi:DNA polymerase-3 subunit alpha